MNIYFFHSIRLHLVSKYSFAITYSNRLHVFESIRLHFFASIRLLILSNRLHFFSHIPLLLLGKYSLAFCSKYSFANTFLNIFLCYYLESNRLHFL